MTQSDNVNRRRFLKTSMTGVIGAGMLPRAADRAMHWESQGRKDHRGL